MRALEHRPSSVAHGSFAPQHVGSSRTRARTHVPCIGRQILNHSATREVPVIFKKKKKVREISLLDFKTYYIATVIKTRWSWDFPGGPVVKNPPSKAGNTGSIPARGTKIPHATGQLSTSAVTKDPACRNEDPMCCN